MLKVVSRQHGSARATDYALQNQFQRRQAGDEPWIWIETPGKAKEIVWERQLIGEQGPSVEELQWVL